MISSAKMAKLSMKARTNWIRIESTGIQHINLHTFTDMSPLELYENSIRSNIFQIYDRLFFKSQSDIVITIWPDGAIDQGLQIQNYIDPYKNDIG